jgi:hypothetical protein
MEEKNSVFFEETGQSLGATRSIAEKTNFSLQPGTVHQEVRSYKSIDKRSD